MHLLIIPGNPPALYFYQLWAEEIQREYAGCSVHISPYPNLPTSRDSLRFLNDTAAAHGRELLAFYESVKKPVTVIGHSLGAWMALQILEKHSAIIESCLLLYPFLLRPSLKGRTILKSVRSLYRVPLIENWLLGARGILQRFFKDLQYVTDEELRTSLAMAYHEYQVIGRAKEAPQIPEQLCTKLHMIYCNEDTWCPPRTINEMKRQISCEKVDSMHDFITSTKERAILSKALFHKLLNKIHPSRQI